ncbi:MAG: glycosyltransferase family 2 protein [Hymenobacter sp.]|nr:MAG: glycosyltransferase family 2 protein [Hymenobacter sp.]
MPVSWWYWKGSINMDKKSQELVSVIIPFLNGSQWLVEAIDSVLAQTYPHWELIVLDDGSAEEHSRVAKEICARHPDKMVYTEHLGHINRGVSISRNEASKLAHGKYLAFLDADDVWMPNKLADQLAMFVTNPQVEVVFGAFTIWQSWQYPAIENYVQPIGAPAGYYPPAMLNKALYPFFDATTPAPSGIMLTKQAFDSIGMFEPAFSGIYELYEDQAFLAKVFLHNHVFVSNQSHLLYRRREGSMSSAASNMERYHTVRVFFCDWLEAYLHNQHIYDPALSKLIAATRQTALQDLAALQLVEVV